MKRYTYSITGKLISVDDVQPQCGDFCDDCGDCLACYGDDECRATTRKEHRWVVYEDGRSDASKS